MGYKNFRLFFETSRLFEYATLKKEWDDILKEAVDHMYDESVMPCEKGLMRLSAFAQMSEVAQMYLCGAFSPTQFQEIRELEEGIYQDRDTLLRQECKTQQEYERETEGLEDISFKDIQSQICHPVFSDVAMSFYEAAMDKMAFGAWLCDISGRNFSKFYTDLDEVQQPNNIYKGDNDFESDAEAVNFLVGIRNGCTVRNERLDYILSFLSNRLYCRAIMALQTLPETTATKGAHYRGIFAASYFLGVYNPNQEENAQSTELLIHEAIGLSKKCVNTMYKDDEEWGKFQSDYIDRVMKDYYTHRIVEKLKEEVMSIEGLSSENPARKIASQSPDISVVDKVKQIGD